MPLETPILAAVPAVLNLALRGTQTSFELQQVPEQTRAIFETIASTKSDIVKAKERRVALGKLYNSDDLAEYDRSVKETEAALTELEKLVESARLDLQHNDGKISAKTRIMWVVKDSKSLSATSHRLTLAHSRMSFAIMMIHMKRHHDSREAQSVPLEDIAPPPYITNRGVPRIATERRERIDTERVTRSTSVGSLNGDLLRSRPTPRPRTTTMPMSSRQDIDFDELLNQHEHAPRPPPLGPLGPLLASVEALSRKHDPFPDTIRAHHRDDHPTPPAQPADTHPSVSHLSLNRIAAMRTNTIRPHRRHIVSPPITPPDSPNQNPTYLSFPNTSESEIRSIRDERARFSSVLTLNPLPTVPETSSIRFELDATHELQSPERLETPRLIFRDIPPIPSVRPADDRSTLSQAPPPHARHTHLLPYPDHERRDPNTSTQGDQNVVPRPTARPRSANKSSAGLKSTPYLFAGHHRPIDIRRKPESRQYMSNEVTQPSEGLSQAPVARIQNSALEFMYQPYRPT